MAKQNPYMGMVYQAFINQGLSPNQARAFAAEVGRENDFNPKFMFGSHTDAANAKTNLGIFSWQKERRNQLINYLNQRNLIDSNGAIERSQRSLDAMAEFALNEIKTNKLYGETKRKVLNNPNVDYNTASRVIGKNFIRWDYDGKTLGENVAKHHTKRDKYFQQLGGVTALPPQTTPTFQATEPTFNTVANAVMDTPKLTAQNTDVDSPQTSTAKKESSNPLSSWDFTKPANTAKPAEPVITDRSEEWRIKPLEFEKPTTDPYADQMAAAFGAIPDTAKAIPDYISQLARQIYDNA